MIGEILSTVVGFFGGSGGSSVVMGLVMLLMASLGFNSCQRSDLERLTGQLSVVESAAEVNARAADELRGELARREQILNALEDERERNEAQAEAIRAAARQVDPDWRAGALSDAVRALPGRLLGNAAGAAGGDVAAGPAGRPVARAGHPGLGRRD